MCLSIYNYYITYYITIITIENDKDIKIKTDEDVGLDDKLKAWARALGKKMEDTDRDRGEEYEAEKGKERAFD